VFEDEHLLVIDKPAGVVVHPARGNRFGTLAQALDGQAAGATSSGARASSTAWTRTPAAYWWSRSQSSSTRAEERPAAARDHA